MLNERNTDADDLQTRQWLSVMVAKSNLQIDSFITAQTSESFWLVNVCVCLQQNKEENTHSEQSLEQSYLHPAGRCVWSVCE